MPNPVITNPAEHRVNALTRNHGTNSCQGQQMAGPNDTESTKPAPRILIAMTGFLGPFALKKRSGSPAVGTTLPAQLQIGGKRKNKLAPLGRFITGQAKNHQVP